jgi:hypothetical protein
MAMKYMPKTLRLYVLISSFDPKFVGLLRSVYINSPLKTDFEYYVRLVVDMNMIQLIF